MKRKGKIITTIASLCLAVALMAFGVYAATTVTMGVTSKVCYVVKDVFVTVKGQVQRGKESTTSTAITGHTLDRQVAGADTTTGENATDDDRYLFWENAPATVTGDSSANTYGGGLSGTGIKSYTEDNGNWTPYDAGAGEITAGGVVSGGYPLAAWDAGEYAFDSTYRYYKMTITITNDSTDTAVWVKLDKIMDDDTDNNELTGTTPTSTYKVNTGAETALAENGVGVQQAISIPASGTLTFTFVRRLDNTMHNVASSFNFGSEGLTITMVNANATNASAFANQA